MAELKTKMSSDSLKMLIAEQSVALRSCRAGMSNFIINDRPGKKFGMERAVCRHETATLLFSVRQLGRPEFLRSMTVRQRIAACPQGLSISW